MRLLDVQTSLRTGLKTLMSGERSQVFDVLKKDLEAFMAWEYTEDLNVRHRLNKFPLSDTYSITIFYFGMLSRLGSCKGKDFLSRIRKIIAGM